MPRYHTSPQDYTTACPECKCEVRCRRTRDGEVVAVRAGPEHDRSCEQWVPDEGRFIWPDEQ
jgi:hypothetical protein